MTIRPATPTDLPAIIDLLRLSLGEGSTPKSEAYWRWKHVDNPFGPSPVLLAEADGRLAGVRAFMRWQWQMGDTTYSALRAVDTATHPDFRGQGIFKKLTLRLVDDCTAAGDDFIFNTPNEQSRPGYLKMGWESLGRVPVRLRLRRPVHLLWRRLRRESTAAANEAFNYEEYSVAKALDHLAQAPWWPGPTRDQLHTPHGVESLRWRYQHCPVQDYGALAGEGFVLIFYLRQQNLGRELRLVQLLTAARRPGGPLRRAVYRIARDFRADYISIAPRADRPNGRLLNRMGFLPGQAVGPILTFRALQKEREALADLQQWRYELGDLELF